MLRLLVFTSFVFVAISAAPTIKDVKELIPKIAQDVLDSLSAEEMTVFKDIIAIKGMEHEIEVLAAIGETSTSLHDKAMKLKREIERKTLTMGPEAQKVTKNYFEFALQQFRNFLMEKEKSIEDINKGLSELNNEFNALSNDAKTEMKREFPSIVKIIEN